MIALVLDCGRVMTLTAIACCGLIDSFEML
jgi:hypothetical protein